LFAESKRTAEIGCPGLFRDKGIGAGFDDASVDVFGAEDAAETRGSLVENVLDNSTRIPAQFFEFEGCGKARDASADDRDARQIKSSAAKAD